MAAPNTEAYTLSQVLGMQAVELAGDPFAQYAIGSGRNAQELPSASVTLEAETLAHICRMFGLMRDQIAVLRSRQVFGQAGPKQYRYLYAELDTEKVFLPYSLHSVSPLPASDAQIRVYKNGAKLEYDVEFTPIPTGINLETPLVADDEVLLEVLSADESRIVEEFFYNADYGTGLGSKVFTLSGLAADTHGRTIVDFPSTASAVRVFKNGLRRILNSDYTITGTGSSMVITFAIALEAEDDVWFEILNLS